MTTLLPFRNICFCSIKTNEDRPINTQDSIIWKDRAQAEKIAHTQ